MFATSTRWPPLRSNTRRLAALAVVAIAFTITATAPPRLDAQTAASLQPLWRVPAPGGTSPVTVGGDAVYLLESDGTDDAARALDAATGAERWRTTIGATHAGAELGPHGRPVVTDRHVIAVTSSCHVVALDNRTGAVAWRIDLGERFKSRFPSRQPCRQSLLAAGTRVIVATGATDADRVVALEASTGEVAGSVTGIPRTLGVTPIALAAGTALVHTVTDARVSGLAAINEHDGSLAWAVSAPEGLSDGEPVVLSPRRVLLQSWSDSRVLDVSGAGSSASVATAWTTTTLTANGTPPVVHGGTIFGFGGNHGDHLMAVDASSGRLEWQQRLFRGSVTRLGDWLVVLSETSGAVRLVRATPERYEEVARQEVLTPGAPAPGPAAIAGDVIYARSTEEVAAVRVVR
jgi:outer membrane protein assembly factor BamB